MRTLDFLLARAKENGAESSGRHQAIEIPNTGRDTLASWFKTLDMNVGVEIGVKEGDYSAVLLTANEQLELFSVDPWLVREDYYDTRGQGVFTKYEAKARKCLGAFGNRSTILKEKSAEAVERFSPRTLDFVYIDGHHNLFNVIQDLHLWSGVVRPGGIIAGHDFVRYTNQAMHVPQGVRAYVDSYQIDPWFLLGRRNPKVPGEYRDKHRTFLWARPTYEANMKDYDPTFGGLTSLTGATL